ncbi:LacI family DNA-binding transcriptional regulator [Pseudomonas syringae pv. actinidiae]|uniref:Periplasmic component n=1 Tax=Pseudomonas syringae pv. actinidiae TaxID=103796 RepID=A0A2V0QB36_PSESF|nr:LacI family transcriptional regulator [Pseudomonas syringae pv. actinidiae ICMP 19070]NVL34620.1 LacI family transcriptional regulator [Pseudomonas syringae pv. actinidiae]NVL37156.1 LacI family transcriptional regulator [Pseudomonas syringae pv. actinidiae]NVL52340.1 LacI family transcriptional regulator [Pseudomonas syringae pv. actinidiae]NVL55065.1 LacI family transcriptional regulator [Pseudomonas syringae pv. actinidiae]
MNNNKRPTIATVAAQAGLSVATVDRVLNARAPVNPATAEQVLKAAQAVGYFAARLIAQRIVEQRPTYRFGVLLLNTAQAFYANLAQAIDQAAQRRIGANLTCQFEYVTDRSPAAIVAQLEQLAVQCDGLAVVSFAHPLINAALEQIRQAGVPVIALLSDIHEKADEPYVGQDNYQVGRTMGWLLARTCGARKGSIGILLGGHRFLGHQARVEGLHSYLAEHAPGLRPLAPLINLDNCDITEEASLELLGSHEDLRGLCVVGGGGDGIISALSQLPRRPALCCILQESTELSRLALARGLVDVVIDSQPLQIAEALINLLVELQTGNGFDPLRHRVYVPLQIVTSENTGA